MNMSRRGLTVLFCACAMLGAVALPGCGADPGNIAAFLAGAAAEQALNPPETPTTSQPSVDTHVLAEDIALEGSTITLPNTAENAAIQVGDIVVGTEGRGFLRRVEAKNVDEQSGTISLDTSQATLAEVVPAGESITTTVHLTPGTATSAKLQQQMQVLGGTRIDLAGVVLAEVDGLQVEIVSGYIEFTPEFEFDIDFGWFLTVDHMLFAADGNLSVNMDVVVTASASASYKPEKTLAEFEWVFLQPLPFPPFVLVETVELSFIGGIDVEALVTGTLEDGFDGTAGLRIGAEYDGDTDDWTSIAEPILEFSVDDPVLDMEGKLGAEVYIKPQINVLLYDIAGPNLNVRPYLGFDGTVTLCDLDWILNVGVTSDIAFEAQIPIIDVDLGSFGPLRIIDWEKEPPLATGSYSWCAACGDGVCEGDEDCESCPEDCGPCGPECGDGVCEGDEDCESCPQDCGPCGPECGDGICEGGETCADCPADCGECGPTLDSSTFVSASGSFTTTSGSFEVAVSPQDSDGNFIGTDLSQDAFTFQDVVMVPQGGGANVGVTTTVIGTAVTEPSEGEAITAVVIFDSSGSMGGNDPGATGRRAAGQAFFDLLTGDDEVAVLDFGPDPTGGLSSSRLLQDFTSDRGLLDAALTQVTENGGTPLYESIIDGLNLLNSRTGGSGTIVVLTDGRADNMTNFSNVITQAGAQNAPVYPIGLGQSVDFPQLRDLAQQTGGGFAEASDSSALASTFSGIGAGVIVGKITVSGRGTYDTAAVGRYTVQGDLVTTGGDESIVTAFSFTADVTE